MYRLIKLTILLHLLPGIEGAITLNCGATSPAFPHSVTCSCINSGGDSVEWWESTTFVSNCLFSVNCSHYPSGKTFSMNQAEQMFTMTVDPYNYNDCQQFTCKDFSNTSIQQSQKPSTIDFDSTMPSVIAEPVSNNTSGDISITTSCISGYSDLIAKWYIVVLQDGTKKQYIPDQDIVIRQIDTTTCIACNSESAATIQLGFQHKEAVGNGASEGHFQLELYHPNYPSDKLVRKTTNVYNVADINEDEECARCFGKWCWLEYPCIILIFILIVLSEVVLYNLNVIICAVVAVIVLCYRIVKRRKAVGPSEINPIELQRREAVEPSEINHIEVQRREAVEPSEINHIEDTSTGSESNTNYEEEPSKPKTDPSVKSMITIMEAIQQRLNPEDLRWVVELAQTGVKKRTDRRGKAVILTGNRPIDVGNENSVWNNTLYNLEEQIPKLIEKNQNRKEVYIILNKINDATKRYLDARSKDIDTSRNEFIQALKKQKTRLEHENQNQLRGLQTKVKKIVKTMEKLLLIDLKWILKDLEEEIRNLPSSCLGADIRENLKGDMRSVQNILGKKSDEYNYTTSEESTSDVEWVKPYHTPSKEYSNSSVKCQKALDNLRENIKETIRMMKENQRQGRSGVRQVALIE